MPPKQERRVTSQLGRLFVCASAWVWCLSAFAVCTPTLEWTWDADLEVPDTARLCAQPIVVQLTDDNGDGRVDVADIPDVLIHHCGTLTPGCGWSAIDGATGTTHFSITDPALKSAELAAADIDGDGIVEVIAAHANDQQLVAFEHTGEVKWLSELFSPAPPFTTRNDPIGIADLDQDGVPEIYTSTRVFKADGRIAWQQPTGTTGHNTSNAVDVDPTIPGLEILAGPRGFSADGTELWNTGHSRGYTAVADFDADGDPEIVLASHEMVLLDHRGSPLGPAHRVAGGWLAQPVIADFDGDGAPEVLAIDRAEMHALSWNGSRFEIEWTLPVEDPTGSSAASAFDFDGDSALEIIYHDHVGWRIIDGRSGAVLSELPLSSRTGIEAPVVADIDGDCRSEILVGGCAASGPGNRLLAYECPDATVARAIWNQYTYHVTNVTDDGRVPVVEESPWTSNRSWLSQVPVDEGQAPRADAGPELSLCAGASTTLDAAASQACPGATLSYRWLGDGVVACDWSSSPTCDVAPVVSTLYTLEVRCEGGAPCGPSTATDTTLVSLEPDPLPGALGPTLRAAKSGADDLELTWTDLVEPVTAYEILSLDCDSDLDGSCDTDPTRATLAGSPSTAARSAPGTELHVETSGLRRPSWLVFYKVRALSPCSETPGPFFAP